MKPVFAKVLDGLQEEVFLTRIISRPFFSTEFHFHTECQMSYIVKSSGQKIIGDCIENFDTGELTFLGSDIPHVWHNNEAAGFLPDHKENKARSVALFFNPDKLTALLSNFFATNKIQQVLQTAKRGMKFYGKTKEQLKELLFNTAEEEGVAKLISLLQIIDILCTTNEYVLLASAGYVNTYQTKDNDRIDKVFKYLFVNFSNEIKLEDIATLACMNKQAFCRFFKARTQKTVVEFINEIRVAHAIKLMSKEDASISSIAYKCGYNSISNFNKFFKNVTGKTPSSYRKNMTKNQ